MDELLLFIDGSVDNQSGIGFGAYLVISDETLSLEVHKTHIHLKRFEHTSSTKLELQAILWALGELHPEDKKVIIHTDSQNLLGLTDRRERLEQNDYRSKNGKRLDNYTLYQEFYSQTDLMDCVLIKVQGHQPSAGKHDIDQLFTLVDRAARNAVRKFIGDRSR